MLSTFWARVIFITITVRVSLNLSYFNNLFLWRNDGEFWYKCIHPCTWKFVYNRPGTVRALADVCIYRRWPAPVRYMITQEKILQNRPVHKGLSNSPVMCNSLKSYDVSFMFDQSITFMNFLFVSTIRYMPSTNPKQYNLVVKTKTSIMSRDVSIGQ